jgi:hypothetical protein
VKLAFNTIKWISNLVGLVTYVASTYQSIGYFSDPQSIINMFEISIAIVFTFELIDDLLRVIQIKLSFKKSHNRFVSLFS